MIYWELLWAFLKIGVFSFGGAYGSIPLIREVVMSYGWVSEELFIYFVAVSESTPGPIMVNLATYIGSSQAGFFGAVLATTGVVLPSFIVILIIARLMKNFIKNRHIQAVLGGIKSCFIGLVMAMGAYLIINNIASSARQGSVAWQTPLMTAALLTLSFGYQIFRKKDFPPVLLIVVSAGMGLLLFS
jgi:chromate transporter